MSFNKDCLPLLCSVFLIQGVFYCSIARCFCHFCAALTSRDSGAKIIFLSPLDISIRIFAISPYFVLWVKYFVNATWRYSWPKCLTYITHFFRYYEYLPIFLGYTDLPKNSSWFPDLCVSGSCIVSFLQQTQQICWWLIGYHALPLLSSSLHIVFAFHACSLFPVLYCGDDYSTASCESAYYIALVFIKLLMAINYYPKEGQCLSCYFYDKFHPLWSSI